MKRTQICERGKASQTGNIRGEEQEETRMIEERRNQVDWILIAGRDEMESPEDWIAYSFSKDAEPSRL